MHSKIAKISSPQNFMLYGMVLYVTHLSVELVFHFHNHKYVGNLKL